MYPFFHNEKPVNISNYHVCDYSEDNLRELLLTKETCHHNRLFDVDKDTMFAIFNHHANKLAKRTRRGKGNTLLLPNSLMKGFYDWSKEDQVASILKQEDQHMMDTLSRCKRILDFHTWDVLPEYFVILYKPPQPLLEPISICDGKIYAIKEYEVRIENDVIFKIDYTSYYELLLIDEFFDR